MSQGVEMACHFSVSNISLTCKQSDQSKYLGFFHSSPTLVNRKAFGENTVDSQGAQIELLKSLIYHNLCRDIWYLSYHLRI